MFPLPVPTTRPTRRESLDEMIEKLDSIHTDIREKAFDFFLTRGGTLGSDLEDWFRAERELFACPKSEVKETDTQFEIKAAVPGFKVEDLHVNVLPEIIVIESKTAEPKREPANGEAGKVHFSEFATKRMFRQYKLAVPIDVMAVEATVDAGILKIVATKQRAQEKSKEIEGPVRTELVKAPEVALAATSK